MSDIPKTSITISGDSRYSDYRETDPALHFVPSEYVRKRTRQLHGNFFLLLVAILALSIPTSTEIPNAKRDTVMLNIAPSCSFVISSLILVPFAMRYLRLHYALVIGALGIGVTSLIYFIQNYNLVSVAIILHGFFDSLFTISKTIYILRLAMISVRLQGKSLSGEFLAMHGLEHFFRHGAVIVSAAWGWVSHAHTLAIDILAEAQVDVNCGIHFCGSTEAITESFNLSTTNEDYHSIFMGLITAVAICGIILIGMYIQPIKELGDDDLAEDPESSSPLKVLYQLRRPGAVYLAAILLIADILAHTTDEFNRAYLECWFSTKYKDLATLVSSLSMIFGFLMPSVLADLFGFHWLLLLALIVRIIVYGFLLNWNPFSRSKVSYFIIFTCLRNSSAMTHCVLKLITVRMIGDQEISAWCFYYGIRNAVRLIWYSTSDHVCTGPKLWTFLVLCILVIIIIDIYRQKFEWKNQVVHMGEHCMQLVETKECSFERTASFDLTEVVEKIEDIEKIETLLKRKYILVTKQSVRSEEDDET